MPAGLAAAGRDRSHAAQVGERGLGAHPCRVVPDRGQQLSGDLDTDAEQIGHSWGGGGDEVVQLGVGVFDLAGQVLVAAGESTQRHLQRLGWVRQRAAAAQPRARLHQDGGLEVLDAFADLGRCCDQQRLELVGGLGAGPELDLAAASSGRRRVLWVRPIA